MSMTTQTPDAVREAVQDLTALANLMERPPLDDVQLTEEVAVQMAGAIRIVLAALDSRVGDAGGKALFEHEMQQRGVDASWADLDEDEREGWRESARAVLSATPAPAVDAVPAGEVE